VAGDAIDLWQDVFEGLLLSDPASRVLRYAALYPLATVVASNPFLDDTPEGKHGRDCFRYLTGLCVTDKLTDPLLIKFELHNAFLGENWTVAEALFARIAELHLLPLSEFHEISGKYWFMSVFGRRIDYEFRKADDGEYEFYWTNCFTVEEWSDTEGARIPLLFRPEVLQESSKESSRLLAWCIEPRKPKAVTIPPEPLPYQHEPGEPSTAPDNPEQTVLKNSFINSLFREFEPNTAVWLQQEERERLEWAVEHLQRIAENPARMRLYRPMLARTQFCLGRLQVAAETFESVRREIVPMPTPLGVGWPVAFMCALCHRLAGDTEAAVTSLSGYAAQLKQLSEKTEGPLRTLLHPYGINWWIAKWYSEDGKYEEAARFLRMEVESTLSPMESWELSALTVLGETITIREGAVHAVRQYLAEKPRELDFLVKLITDVWPTFERLLPDSQKAWIAAAFIASSVAPIPHVESRLMSEAIREYGLSVEHELRMRLFIPFRDELQKNSDALRTVKDDKRTYGQTSGLYRFVADREPIIEFGAMHHALEQCQHSVVQTEVWFHSHVAKMAPKLFELLPALKRAVEFRTPATHKFPDFTEVEVREMAKNCKNVLDALYRREIASEAVR
jgi:hypothetical protein